MRILGIYLKYLLLISIATFLNACTDDAIDSPWSGVYPDGSITVKAKLDFEPFSNNDNTSRTADGKLMDRLDDLCLLVYDNKGDLVEGFPLEITTEEHGLTITDVEREPDNASNGDLAEKKTKRATFDISLAYGEYYIYAVANLGKMKSDNTREKTIDVLTTGKYKDYVSSRTKLLNAPMEWDASNMLNNCEMLGCFSKGKESNAPFTGESMNSGTVRVDNTCDAIHSWIRRCASKVTIDFDGSGLRENILIYLRRATIHDIASQCALGRPNAAGENGPELITYKNADDYRPTANADCITYGEGTDYHAWPSIAKGSPYIMDGDKRKEFHNEDSEALYLYENMQGDSEDEKNKEQHPAGDGTVVGADEMKDEMPYGSYIEVEGYYDHSSSTEVSQGKIIYRFMLGKDVLKNFDVERNHHYKLTLCIRGNGNDVDWHIEYNEESDFEFRDPYYVSYIYNHESTVRFRYTPPQGWTVTTLDAEIVGNNWWPDDPSTSYQKNAANEQNPLRDDEKGDPLNASFTKNLYPDDESVHVNLRGRIKYLGNGFLSLRATDKTTIKMPETTDLYTVANSGDFIWMGTDDPDKKNQYMNDNYFYGVSTKNFTNTTDRSKRTYYFNGENDPTNTGREAYTVEKAENGSLRFNLPVFTRAKNIVKESAYTGNNPYEASSRSAYIRITAHLKKGDKTDKKSQIIRVEQVPRITNPKAIYRKSGNNENFHVHLLEKDKDNGDEFVSFESDGPWMAEVIGEPNFINLNGRTTIKGSTKSPIEFNVRFNKMNRDNKVRNAIIRIRYHNYSCVHLIFVRQGYSSQAIVPDGEEWHTTNMICDNAEGDDPRDEGSLFKFGNLTDPIDVSSNVYDPVGIAPSVFTIPDRLNIATGKTTYTTEANTWSEIKGDNKGFPGSNVASMADFEKLYKNDNVEHGFGVLYADGATETRTSVLDAYGYCRHDPKEDRDKRGMCGVVIYYWDKNNTSEPYNCRNIFFPIGRSGYGHRRHWDGTNRNGVLRYACGRSEKYPDDNARWLPLFHDLYMRKGAIYWAKEIASAKPATGEAPVDNAMGLDLNFFTFDVNLIFRSNVQKNSQWSGSENPDHLDACFLRTVGHLELPVE